MSLSISGNIISLTFLFARCACWLLGYKDCADFNLLQSLYFQASSTSNGLCLPHSKPRRCREKAWEQLQDYYHGIKCPETPIIGGVGAPEYLSIVGHERCLGENLNGGFVSICMPGVKPLSCEVKIKNRTIFVSYYFIYCK